MSRTTPNERRWVAIPANNSISQPLFQGFDIKGMIALQRSPFDDPLH